MVIYGMNKWIRKSIIFDMARDTDLLKAVAMMLYIRSKIGTSQISNYTINKVAQITSMHSNTVKKRLHTLFDYHLAEIKGNTLYLRSIASKHTKRNIRIAKIQYNAQVKETQRSLQAILIAVLQLRKEFAKRTILIAHNGHTTNEVRRARKISRRYRWKESYTENGLGYKRITKFLGCCWATVAKILNYAEKRNILKRHRHYEYTKLPYVNYMDLYGIYTYTTRHYGVNVRANTYEVAKVLCVGWL